MKYYKVKVNNGSLYKCWVVISGGKSILSTEHNCAIVSEKLLHDKEIEKYTKEYKVEYIPIDNIGSIPHFRIYDDII